ncbi:hypothetical protein [uncultured Sanguibacteroides sp.]|uniref:hypothetical protein n=1 Tax=uncultured Sanguibacteroides sp. TaxID=1635151 RepID=UPI0025FC6D0A|nr:hypothetical protein [uncultured Sanguibacteroides sp.]
MLYARKINSNAWFIGPSLDSDAVSELGTFEHTLSVWKVSDDKQDLDNIALALALTRDKVDEMYIVFLDIESIKTKYKWNLQLIPQTGNTHYEKMCDYHINFKVENFWEQGFLAEHIKILLKDTNNYVYYDVPTLEKLLYEAVKKKDIPREEINKIGKWNKSLKKLEEQYGKLS